MIDKLKNLMKDILKGKITLRLYCVSIAITFLLGVGLYTLLNSISGMGESSEKKILYWVAPMDPNYRRDKPGKSPMGMDLVPVYEGESGAADDSSIKISPTVEHNLGVRTAKVTKGDISRIIDTVGSIAVDENQIEHVHVYSDGWIKELLIKAEGEKVEKGQLLFRIYSPKLVNAQEEYLLALKNSNSDLRKAAQKKLLSLGFSEKQMKKLSKSRKVSELTDVYSEQDGIISQLNVGEGMYVKPDKALVVIEDLTNIWLIAEVYERQSNWVKVGQEAEMTMPYIPGKIWKGEVNYIYPTLDAKSHTLKVRMKFKNDSGDLKLNMFANVKIKSNPKKDSLVIPREAVIHTGSETRVVLKVEKGKYKTQVVKIGIESDEKVEILEGLSEDDIIVTSAQFMIDSESSLASSYNRISPSDEGSSDHSHHEQ